MSELVHYGEVGLVGRLDRAECRVELPEVNVVRVLFLQRLSCSGASGVRG